jgi:hypothetical protein
MFDYGRVKTSRMFFVEALFDQLPTPNRLDFSYDDLVRQAGGLTA